MKKMGKFWGIIVFAAIVGFFLVSCDNETTSDSYNAGHQEQPLGNVAVTGMSLNTNATTILQGYTQTLHAIIAPANATNRNVTWSSSNQAVAAVSADGVVTAVSAGTATITVTTVDGGFTDSAIVTVSDTAVPVTGVSLNESNLNIFVGGNRTLLATVMPSGATNQNVTWSSNNTGVATVSQAGEVTAIAPGTATITVTTVVWWLYSRLCCNRNWHSLRLGALSPHYSYRNGWFVMGLGDKWGRPTWRWHNNE